MIWSLQHLLLIAVVCPGEACITVVHRSLCCAIVTYLLNLLEEVVLGSCATHLTFTAAIDTEHAVVTLHIVL